MLSATWSATGPCVARNDQPLPPAGRRREASKRAGLTPGAYLRSLRLEAARRALLETDRPLTEIAFDAGFFDQAHFTRAFRRAIGLPPAAFRRLHAPLGRRRSRPRFSAS